jgi:hypothetical protein
MSNKGTSILTGGLAIALLATLLALIPTIGPFISCLGVIAGAMVAVWHYTSTYGVSLPAGEGAGVGALAGVVGAILGILLGLLLVQAGVIPDPQQVVQEQLRDMPAEQREMAERMARWGQGPIGWIISIVIYSILGAIGGAIGASVFRRSAPADRDRL